MNILKTTLLTCNSRERTADRPAVTYSFTGTLPFPNKSTRKNHYRGPWIQSGDWNTFPVEILVEADDRTLKSWEQYKKRNTDPENMQGSPKDHIAYSIDLPPVPTYPDHQLVMTKVPNLEVMIVLERTDTGPSGGSTRQVNAHIPHSRKAPTVSYQITTAPKGNSSRTSTSDVSIYTSVNGAAGESFETVQISEGGTPRESVEMTILSRPPPTTAESPPSSSLCSPTTRSDSLSDRGNRVVSGPHMQAPSLPALPGDRQLDSPVNLDLFQDPALSVRLAATITPVEDSGEGATASSNPSESHPLQDPMTTAEDEVPLL